MDDLITVTGVVGSDPRHSITSSGLEITSFRLASTRRVFDRSSQTWVDSSTNWYTVSTFRRLAQNVAVAVRKGEHVIVTGRFKLRAWETAEKHGIAAEIEADAVGHDLTWCVTRPARLESVGGQFGGHQIAPEPTGETGEVGEIGEMGEFGAEAGELVDEAIAADLAGWQRADSGDDAESMRALALAE